MSKDWQIRTEAEVDATPEQVWQAVATSRGLDGWFSGSNELQPGAGGTLRSTTGGFTDELSVTIWEPGRRVVYRSSPAENGQYYALEWLVEGRAGGAVLRCVASGFLPGDNWEVELDSLEAGGAMYFQTLVEYLTHFRDRTALVVDTFGPPMADWDHAWRELTDGLGLNGTVNRGDRVRLTPAGLAPIEGVVYAAAKHVLTVRSGDGLYRFVRFGPVALASHRLFTPEVDKQQAEQAWQGWLSHVFA